MGFMSARLRKAMQERGVERSDLSRMTGSSHRVVTSWFTGERKPNCASLARICRALDVSSDYLLGLREEMK